jgi:DNA-binding response OmpR family regulator
MPKKILLVDDEESLVQLLSERLKFNGYEVITASDGQEGFEKAKKEKPDLILLDVMMPHMDGYQVCRLLKFDQRYKDIPIIMLTARTQEIDKKTGKETGADAYITKPFESQDLLKEIKKLLKE